MHTNKDRGIEHLISSTKDTFCLYIGADVRDGNFTILSDKLHSEFEVIADIEKHDKAHCSIVQTTIFQPRNKSNDLSVFVLSYEVDKLEPYNKEKYRYMVRSISRNEIENYISV